MLVLVLAAVLVVLISSLRRKVQEQFASRDTEVESYAVQSGTISTQPATLAQGAPGGGMSDGGRDSMGDSGMSGGIGGSTVVDVFEPYSLDTLTVATVTSQQTIELDITVDEADILLLEVGQKAELMVSALGGEIFDATITHISNDGSNEGGRTKFTVTAAAQKHMDMYPGMTGTLSVDVHGVENAVALPLAALAEKETQMYVYTGFDDEAETLTNPVLVSTGISDGEYVEVFGIEEGETVYYAYYDTLEYSLIPEKGQF